MKTLKPLLLSLTIGIGIISSPAQAGGVFNSKIANPFVFCKLPKPCKACQPFRKIHEEICAAGQPSAEAKKAYQDAVNQGYGSANNIDAVQSQFTPAIASAYDDVPTDVEIEKYIGWLARQKGPNFTNPVFGTMSEYWRSKGIMNPYTDPTIKNTAIQVIKDRNQQIIAAISAGTIPSNPKPWFSEQQPTQSPPQSQYMPKEVDIERYIGWLARQPGPKNGVAVFPTMADYWKAQGIVNPYNDPTIRNIAIQGIKDANQKNTPTGVIPSNPKVTTSQQFK